MHDSNPSRPTGNPDRLRLQATQLRMLADELDAQAESIKPKRQALNSRDTVLRLAGLDPATYDPTFTYHRTDDEEQRSVLACAYCGNEVHVHSEGACDPDTSCAQVDHIVPVSKGGAHAFENFAIACSSCNAAKRDRTPLEWAVARLLDVVGSEDEPEWQASPVSGWALMRWYLVEIIRRQAAGRFDAPQGSDVPDAVSTWYRGELDPREILSDSAIEAMEDAGVTAHFSRTAGHDEGRIEALRAVYEVQEKFIADGRLAEPLVKLIYADGAEAL